MDADRVGQIYDTLLVQSYYKLRLPKWTQSVFPGKMHAVRARAALIPTETHYMKRIKGGKLLTNIATQLRRKKSTKLTQKIQIYSAHDSTLVSVMHALGVIRQTTATPAYGAALAFELNDSRKGCGDWLLEVSGIRPNSTRSDNLHGIEQLRRRIP